MTISDGIASLAGAKQCKDAIHDNLASPQIVKRDVLKDIGKYESIIPISVHVALTSAEKAKMFNFSRKCKVPYIVPKLSVALLALKRFPFFRQRRQFIMQRLHPRASSTTSPRHRFAHTARTKPVSIVRSRLRKRE